MALKSSTPLFAMIRSIAKLDQKKRNIFELKSIIFIKKNARYGKQCLCFKYVCLMRKKTVSCRNNYTIERLGVNDLIGFIPVHPAQPGSSLCPVTSNEIFQV